MSTFAKYAKNGFLALLAVIVFLNLWQLAARSVFKQELPELFGYSNLVVLSGSMEPAVSAGDLIVIRRQESYEKDDVITYRDEGAFTTHRIIEETSDGFLTQGDANNVKDERMVLPDQIKGRVVLVVPSVGKILLFFRTPVGMGCVLILGLLLLLAGEHGND